MKSILFVLIASLGLTACPQPAAEEAPVEAAKPAKKALEVVYEAPAALPVPEKQVAKADDDWPARINNKNREVVELINILNPVAGFLTAGFEQYGPKLSETLHEEWADTQVQLTKALTLYDGCKERMAAGTTDKQLYLDLEEVWQILVKTGVAGLRTKSMIDDELKRLAGY